MDLAEAFERGRNAYASGHLPQYTIFQDEFGHVAVFSEHAQSTSLLNGVRIHDFSTSNGRIWMSASTRQVQAFDRFLFSLSMQPFGVLPVLMAGTKWQLRVAPTGGA
ncbi:hypothetical protein CS053_10020 [Rhodanobacter glycinis]|uniref:Uncharacterized protein n=1 Tax=Rhodanobacter glycinis TaxID=582702 RepID=A0A5B9E3L4_9GAMM|nr:hypothetical protein [Rhodanobacter glycinis]QEE24796.1 hypothetical protein CS053_10020 [Rhodanobacter glycinis]